MRYYESLYIVNPNYEQSRIDEVMKMVSDKGNDYKFKIINHQVWGKKRLAYSIQKHKYGSFILLHFGSKMVDKLKEFDRFMFLHNDILRNQTVVLDQEPKILTEDEYKIKNNDTINETDEKADVEKNESDNLKEEANEESAKKEKE